MCVSALLKWKLDFFHYFTNKRKIFFVLPLPQGDEEYGKNLIIILISLESEDRESIPLCCATLPCLIGSILNHLSTNHLKFRVYYAATVMCRCLASSFFLSLFCYYSFHSDLINRIYVKNGVYRHLY